MDRHARDVDWLCRDESGEVPTWERAGVAVLMDIRRELRRLNAAISSWSTSSMRTTHGSQRIGRPWARKLRCSPSRSSPRKRGARSCCRREP